MDTLYGHSIWTLWDHVVCQGDTLVPKASIWTLYMDTLYGYSRIVWYVKVTLESLRRPYGYGHWRVV